MHSCRSHQWLAVPLASQLSSVARHPHILFAQSSGRTSCMIIWLMPTDALKAGPSFSCSLLLPQDRPPAGAPTSLNEQPVNSQAGLVSKRTHTWVVNGEGTGLGGGTLVETLSSCPGREPPVPAQHPGETISSSRKQEVSHGLRRPAGCLASRVQLMNTWTEGPSLKPGKQEGGLEEEERRGDPLPSKTGSPVGPSGR